MYANTYTHTYTHTQFLRTARHAARTQRNWARAQNPVDRESSFRIRNLTIPRNLGRNVSKTESMMGVPRNANDADHSDDTVRAMAPRNRGTRKLDPESNGSYLRSFTVPPSSDSLGPRTCPTVVSYHLPPSLDKV
jgi:hypothetical protein